MLRLMRTIRTGTGVLVACSLLAACKDEGTTAPEPTPVVDVDAPRAITPAQRAALVEKMGGEPTSVYTVRGIISSLPAGADPMAIRHEAIDNFVDKDGNVVGMDAMTMDFPLAADELIDGYAPDDKVLVTFEVWWGPRLGYFATAFERLPAETELTFVRASPPPQD